MPLVSYRTLADRVGAWPEYLIIALTVLALGWAVLRPAPPGTRDTGPRAAAPE